MKEKSLLIQASDTTVKIMDEIERKITKNIDYSIEEQNELLRDIKEAFIDIEYGKEDLLDEINILDKKIDKNEEISIVQKDILENMQEINKASKESIENMNKVINSELYLMTIELKRLKEKIDEQNERIEESRKEQNEMRELIKVLKESIDYNNQPFYKKIFTEEEEK